jgi:TPR repeat protein
VLLILLTLGFVRLTAAEPEEIASLRLKAEKGNALAQYNLGLAYAQGHLVPADLAEAFAWLTLASESGATGKALDSLLGSITDQQLAEGRKRLGSYRAALAAKNAPTAPGHTSTPKLAPRGFSIEPPPTTVPPTSETSTPVTKAPEAPAAPATSPADGSDRNELAQSRKDLEKTRADLLAASNELTTLRASVARLEAEATTAKATEARLTGKLQATRQELDALKAATHLTPIETTKAEPVAPKKP